MRGADTLIPVRFTILVGQLCVLSNFLWEEKRSMSFSSASDPSLQSAHHHRLEVGFSVSIALTLLELINFVLGLTMFSLSMSLLSIMVHGSGTLMLTYFALEGWICEWFWPLFFFYSVSTEQQLTGTYKEGWTFYLILAGFATTLGASLPVGYNIGVVNTPAELIKGFCNSSIISRYDVVLDDTAMDILWSSVVSIFIVGGCTGSILGAYCADKFGRKKATLVAMVLSILGAINFLLSRSANSVEMLVLGRLLVGLAGGLTTSIVPMYLTELAPASLTGAMGVVCPMGVNVGVLVGQVMGLEFFLGGPDDWPYLLACFAVLVVLCVPMICVLPESPKYLFVVRRKEGTALKELSRLRGVAHSLLTADLAQLRAETLASSSSEQSWSMIRVLRDPRLRLPLLLACALQAGQQTSGINAVFYYSKTIFEQAGLSDANSQYATIGCGAINVCTAILMLELLPRFGRRPLLLLSISAAVVALAGLAAAVKYMDATPWMPYVCMVAVLSYVLVYGLGLGPIPYFIASELFPVSPRGAGVAWGSLANWAGNLLVGMSFRSVRAALGPACFLLFAAATAALLLLVKLYFPETKGKTPTEVSELLSRGFKSKPLQETRADV